jgi:PD-(D/E)XK nuclease superfamily
LPASPSVHIARYRTIAAAAAERLLAGRGDDPLRPWAEEVIVPSRGMAEAITAELLARVPNGVAALQLRFLEDLARSIVNDAGEFPRVASDIERRLAMRMAVRAVEHPMMEGRGMAAMLERSYRDVRDGGMTVDELARRSGSPRSKVIVRVFREYERVVASLGAIDGADLLARAAALAPRAGLRPQLVAGFYDMTGAQLAFVKSLPVAKMWAPARPLVECGGSPPLYESDSGGKPPHSKSAFDTRYTELRSVCAEIAQLLAAGETSIAVTARSLTPYDARLINRFAAEFGFTTTLAEELPLHAHRLGRAALTLLRLRERGFPRADVLELVRDGLHLRTRLNVDDVDAATRRARVAGGTSEELRVLRNRSQLIDDYIALVAELEELTSTLDVTRLGSLARIETELDLAAADLLDEITAVFERAHALADSASLVDAIENASIRRGGRGAAVWAGAVLQMRGRTFDHLFVVGLQDDVFPQRRVEDPLIPDSERRKIGLREIGDGAEEERLLFQLLLDSAQTNVRFTYATGDGFGKVLRPSRFVRHVVAAQSPGVPRSSLVVPRSRQLQLLVKSGTQSTFDGYIPALREFVEQKLSTLSPTQLEDFGECPHKFLLKHLLGVEDLDHPEREIQVHHRDKGTLDHRVLERFYRSMTAEERNAALHALPRLPEELGQRLDHLVDQSFDKHEHDVPPFNRTVRGIERRATKRILREFVLTDLAELETASLVPKHFEFQFGAVSKRRPNPSAPAFTVDTGNVSLRVEGTIDRIDEAEDGKYRIVDYKSGKALRHDKLAEKIDRGVRLQLALYAMAVANIFGADAENISGTIKPLVTGEGKPRFAFALHEKQERLLETLALFTNAIRDCLFPAFPSRDDDFDSCKYCPVNHSCRTRHDLDERYAIQQLRDPRTLLSGGA